MSAAAYEVKNKLGELAGNGPLKVQIATAQSSLARISGRRWRNAQAAGRIKRFLYLEQKPQADEVDDVRAAHALFGAKKIEANREENRRLADSIRAFVEIAERSDPDFYQPQLEALGEALRRLGCMGGPQGKRN